MNGKKSGFTFIELVLVMAVLGLIIGLVAPNYFRHLEEARETALKNNLSVMRKAIDDYYADTGRYPESLAVLVDARYIKNIPKDPVTDSATTWKTSPPLEGNNGIYDIISGAEGSSSEGIPYGQF